MAKDPLNAVAQLWLWRLEAQVLAALIFVAFAALWLLVYIALGDDAAEALIFALFLGCGAVVVGSVLRALYLVCSPDARLRKADKAMAKYDALVESRLRGRLE